MSIRQLTTKEMIELQMSLGIYREPDYHKGFADLGTTCKPDGIKASSKAAALRRSRSGGLT